jgi:hypothetical protein
VTVPKRIQLRRTKGWRKPDGAIVVARPSIYGNPFGIYEHCKGAGGDWGVHDLGRFKAPYGHGWTRIGAASAAVNLYQRAFLETYRDGGMHQWTLLNPLKGHDLACWCPLDQPCHADVLLELANR